MMPLSHYIITLFVLFAFIKEKLYIKVLIKLDSWKLIIKSLLSSYVTLCCYLNALT